MENSMEERLEAERQIEIGSLGDLQQIAELAIPPKVTYEEAATCLENNHVPESFITAITSATPQHFGQWLLNSGDSDAPFLTAKHYSLEITAQVLPYGLPPDEHGNYREEWYRDLNIHVRRNTPAQLFNFGYLLDLPVKLGSYELERRATPQRPMGPWAILSSPPQSIPRQATPMELLLIVREAAQDLYGAIKLEQQRQYASSLAGQVAVEKTVEEQGQ